MEAKKEPVTQAVRALRSAGVSFQGHLYDYVAGGTARFAETQRVDEHGVIKTLIMEDENAKPFIVLMHGDREVATGALAREIGVKRIRTCYPETAERHSGYRVGGTSPFGTRRAMTVYCEASIAELPRIYINCGKRGFIIAMRTRDALDLLKPRLVNAARRSQLYQGLLELDARINDISEGDPGRPLLASHPLYQYLARRYGLNPRSVAWGPEEVPSERQWTGLKGILREHPAKWMLWEGAPAEETVERSRALGVKSVVVNPCGNRPAIGAFLTVMSEYARNLERIFRQVSGDP